MKYNHEEFIAIKNISHVRNL